MSMDYSGHIVVGYLVTEENFKKTFHAPFMESGYRFDGKEFESYDALTDELEERFDCDLKMHGNLCTGDPVFYTFGVRCVKPAESLTLAQVHSAELALARLRSLLQDQHKMELEEGVIHHVWTYG